MKTSKEITKANDLVAQAKAITIATHGDAVFAAEFLTQANKALDLLTTKENERTKRIKEELEFIKAPYIEPKRALKTIIADLRTKLGAYQTQGTIAADIEANKIADKALSGKLSAEKAVAQLDAIDAPTKKIGVNSGTLSFRPKQVLEIISFDDIPRNFLVPDMDAILRQMKEGLKVPGCILKTVQVPINRRN